jgi:hypothetical protein
MDEKDLTGKTCGIWDEETRRKRQAERDAEHNRIIQIGEMRFGEGLSDLGREREAARHNRDQSKTVSIPSEAVTLAEARQIFDFTFSIPSWLPDGFAMSDKVYIPGLFKGHRTPHIQIGWSHADRQNFGLGIWWHKNTSRMVYGLMPVEENGVSEVQVSGQPAALITRTRGFVYKTGESIVMEHPCLVWMIDDVKYYLSCGTDALSTEEMIRIVESVRHDANLNAS